MVKKIIGYGLIIFGLFFGEVQAAEKLDLATCLRRAYRNNHLLKASEWQVASAREQLKATEARRWPEISFNSLYTRVGKVSSFSFSTAPDAPPRKFTFGTPNRVNLDLRLQMPVFTWWRVSSLIELARGGQEISQFQQEQQQLNTTDQVLRAFYAVVLNNQVVKLLEENIARTGVYLQTTQRRFEAGQVPRLEVMRAQVQLSNEENNLETAKGNLQKSKIFLAKTIGSPDEEVDVAGELEFHSLVVDREQFVREALQYRLDLKILHLQRELNQSEIALTQSADKPNLFLFSGYNVTNGFDPTDPNRFVDNWNIGVQLSWPLFNGFRTRHEVQSARINQKITELREAELREMLVVQIQQALVNLKQSENQIQSQEKNIELAREALKMAGDQYEQGFISALDLVESQKGLLQTELAHIQTVFNHIMTKIDLGKAVGRYQWFAVDAD